MFLQIILFISTPAVLNSTLQYTTVHNILECLYLNNMDVDIEIDDLALSQICAVGELKYM